MAVTIKKNKRRLSIGLALASFWLHSVSFVHVTPALIYFRMDGHTKKGGWILPTELVPRQ